MCECVGERDGVCVCVGGERVCVCVGGERDRVRV